MSKSKAIDSLEYLIAEERILTKHKNLLQKQLIRLQIQELKLLQMKRELSEQKGIMNLSNAGSSSEQPEGVQPENASDSKLEKLNLEVKETFQGLHPMYEFCEDKPEN